MDGDRRIIENHFEKIEEENSSMTNHKDLLKRLELAEDMQQKALASIENHFDIIKKMNKRINQIESRLGQGKVNLTLKEAAVYTGLSESQLYLLTSKQAIPHSKPMGKVIFFNKKEIDTWLQRNKIECIVDYINDQTYLAND